MSKFAQIVFLSGDEAAEFLDAEWFTYEKAIEVLSDWDMGEYHDVRDSPSAGTNDTQFMQDDYILTVNFRMGYLGLERIV